MQLLAVTAVDGRRGVQSRARATARPQATFTNAITGRSALPTCSLPKCAMANTGRVDQAAAVGLGERDVEVGGAVLVEQATELIRDAAEVRAATCAGVLDPLAAAPRARVRGDDLGAVDDADRVQVGDDHELPPHVISGGGVAGWKSKLGRWRGAARPYNMRCSYDTLALACRQLPGSVVRLSAEGR